MGSIAITNGTLVDGAGTRRADLLIQNGVIAEVGEKLDGDTIIDADGLVVTPGFVDLQVHFREPAVKRQRPSRPVLVAPRSVGSPPWS